MIEFQDLKQSRDEAERRVKELQGTLQTVRDEASKDQERARNEAAELQERLQTVLQESERADDDAFRRTKAEDDSH